jgi:predicted  nucleic acid-binding Zn-ribbon protein
MQAPIAEQHALLQLQAHDSAIDRLEHRRASLPEDARLAERGDALAAVAQLTAEREGTLATLQRNQARLEHEVDTVTAKARAEEARAASGKVTSPKELTAIQEEVAGLKRRQGTLEDELLELMEQRETLEGELAELASRREGFTAEQAQVTKARDAALVELDRELDVQRRAREEIVPGISEELRALYDQIRSRQGGIGAAALVGNTCQGCRVSIAPVELAALRKLPPDEIKRCENCRRVLVVG